MIPIADFGLEMSVWADKTKSISGLVLIGSRERMAANTLEVADEHSDWDFQVITSNPGILLRPDWISGRRKNRLYAYAIRRGKIGGPLKINAILADAELDIIVIPERTARLIALLVKLGLHRKDGVVRRRVQSLAEIIRPGWRFLKGASKWDPIYRKIIREVTDPFLSDADAMNLAEGLVCDYVWCTHKILRGEFRAAQRVLFQEIAEVNLQLLHEIRRRRGDPTYPKARRIEKIATAHELDGVTVVASIESEALTVALEKAASTCRELMRHLTGNAWKWPAIG